MGWWVYGSGWAYVCTQTHAHFIHVGVGGGCDFLSRAERERMIDFVENVTFHCMYTCIVIGMHYLYRLTLLLIVFIVNSVVVVVFSYVKFL